MGLGEATYSVKHLGKQKECSVLLLLRTAAYQRVNIIAHEPFHLQQEVKACDYTQQVITEHPAGNLLPFQRERSKPTRGGGGEERKMLPACAWDQCWAQPQKFSERKGEIWTEESESTFSAWLFMCLGFDPTHQNKWEVCHQLQWKQKQVLSPWGLLAVCRKS